jgi:hypothetical protein
MKTRLTNEQVFNIVYLLKSKYPDLEKYDKRFNFAVTRTLANIQPIAADILKARESGVKGYKEFEQKKISIIGFYSVSGVYKTDEDKQKCQEEVNKLVEDNKEILEERKKEVEIYNEILGQEVEVDVIPCKFEALPDNFDFNILRILCKENDDEIEAML